jgi:hypothetical protein
MALLALLQGRDLFQRQRGSRSRPHIRSRRASGQATERSSRPRPLAHCQRSDGGSQRHGTHKERVLPVTAMLFYRPTLSSRRAAIPLAPFIRSSPSSIAGRATNSRVRGALLERRRAHNGSGDYQEQVREARLIEVLAKEIEDEGRDKPDERPDSIKPAVRKEFGEGLPLTGVNPSSISWSEPLGDAAVA